MPTPVAPAALTVQGLGRKLPGAGRSQAERWILRGIDLHLAHGECVAVIGESGVGKSTLLNLIAGLDQADSGSVTVDDDGNPLRIDQLGPRERARARGRLFGFVFQAFHLVPHLTLAQNVALPLLLSGQAESLARERASALLQGLGLGERLQALPGQLSGGEQQRVALARALVHRPPVILADEPTGNLDPVSAKRALSLLRETARAAHAAILLVTHSQQAAATADRCLRLEPERLVACDRSGDILGLA